MQDRKIDLKAEHVANAIATRTGRDAEFSCDREKRFRDFIFVCAEREEEKSRD